MRHNAETTLKRNVRPVRIGKLILGGGAPVSIQTMWKQPLPYGLCGVSEKIHSLAALGCDLIRFAVPDTDQAELLGMLAKTTDMPLVADIHFDYKLALRCMDFPIAKVRINPGNIGAAWKIEEVIKKAAEKGIALRVGINGGSLPAKLRSERNVPLAMLKTAEQELEYFERLNFKNVVFSLKSSSIEDTIAANEEFAKRYDYPLHLGVTEAGPLIPGIVKSAIAFSKLLDQGIGETIRVSLSDSPENEIIAAREILLSARKRKGGVSIISCPRCARASFDVHAFVSTLQDYLFRIDNNITVAVMGCVVNGPEEAAHADIGITGAGNKAVIFRKGKAVCTVPFEEALDRFKAELSNL